MTVNFNAKYAGTRDRAGFRASVKLSEKVGYQPLDSQGLPLLSEQD